MASGSTDFEPYIPPPDYTKVSTKEWEQDLQKHTSPLRGLAIDPKYPPNKEDAERVLQRLRKENKERKLVETAPQPTFSGEAAQSSEAGEKAVDPFRGSGASKIFNTAPTTDEIINTIPRAGGNGYHKFENKEVTFSNAVKTIELSDAASIVKQPCVREALLQGGPAGGVVGGAMWIVGRPTWMALNWGFWTFMGVTIAGYQWCQHIRKREKEGMRAAVHIVQEKQEEKRKRLQELRAQRLQRMEEMKAQERVEIESAQKQSRRSWFFPFRGRPGEREG